MKANAKGSLHKLGPEAEVAFLFESRRKKRRESEVRQAVQGSHVLSEISQKNLLDQLLEGGWGKFAHCMVRHFKSPRLYGHKIIDIAIITTVYDRTVASISPVMFAAISAPEFMEETGMDESNIRKALADLVKKAVLLKIKVNAHVIFWGLNPNFFRLATRAESIQVNSTRVNVTQVDSPCVKEGDSPRVNTRQTNPGESEQVPGNQKGFSDAKNLLQESVEESFLIEGKFPKDMVSRWNRLQHIGAFGQLEREKRIFEKMLTEHGKKFFDLCGSVVEFVEQKGTSKEGNYSPIHCPMSWIQGHWERNLSLYQTWKFDRENRDQMEAQRLNQKAKQDAERAERERCEARQMKESEDGARVVNEGAVRLLDAYSAEEDVTAFSREAVALENSDFLLSWLEKYGWNHPMIRECVVRHFLKVEAGERSTCVLPSRKAEMV